MKFTKSIVASLLASVAVARPRAFDKNDPLPETSRITSFSVKDNNVSVECWEVSVAQTSQIQLTDGTSATAQALSLASSGELDGLDILTWPSFAPIWPPPGNVAVHAESFDLAQFQSMFSVQTGIVKVDLPRQGGRFGSSADEKIISHIFDQQNGNDWFYFEDNTSSASSTDTEPYPIRLSTISGTDTELLRLKFKKQPTHKVVHKGACRFNGIKTPGDSSSGEAGTARVHSPLTVQVTFEDNL